MELAPVSQPTPISPIPSPRPLARPSPKRTNPEIGCKQLFDEKDDEVLPVEKDASEQIISKVYHDPLLCIDEFRWPSEDRDESAPVSVVGFKGYKEAQAKLLEFGFTHQRIEKTLLELLKSNPTLHSDNLVLQAINKLTSPDSEDTKSPTSDSSRDGEAIDLLITWTVASLRARLKRQPNPQVPGFPVNLRHQWTGLDPGRRALEFWLNSNNFGNDEMAFKHLQESLNAAVVFDPKSKKSSTGETLQLSKNGQTKLLGLLANAAQGLKDNAPREPRTLRPRIRGRTRVLDVDDDNALLAVWERVGASLRATQVKAASSVKVMSAVVEKKETKEEEKVSTFASQAANDLKCAVCWDDLEVNAPTNEDDIESAIVPLTSMSAVVRIPNCGHTLCCECTYGWLKSNITSGRLSGDCMRCPLANIPETSGGHGTSNGSTAAELEQQEVEMLIRITAKVGLKVEADAAKVAAQLAAKQEKERREKAEVSERQDVVNHLAEGAAKTFGGGTCATGNGFGLRTHPLRAFQIPSSGYRCDGACNRVFKPGDQLFGCRSCNYDLCFSCLLDKFSFKKTLLGMLGDRLVKPCPEDEPKEDDYPLPPLPPPVCVAKKQTAGVLPPPLISSSSSRSSISSDHSPQSSPAKPRIVEYEDTSKLQNRPVALFFASNDPKSEEAVEALKRVYSTIIENGEENKDRKNLGALKDCEIVFIASAVNRNGHGMVPNEASCFFHARMPWLAMQFFHTDRRKLLTTLSIREAPRLVIFDNDRRIIKRLDFDGIKELDPLTFEPDLKADHGMDGRNHMFAAQSVFSSSLTTKSGTWQTRRDFVQAALDKDKTLSSEARSLLEERIRVAADVIQSTVPELDDFVCSDENDQLDALKNDVIAAGDQNTVEAPKKDTEKEEDEEPLLLRKFHKFLANREAERIPGTRWCYRPGCETAILPSARRRVRTAKLSQPSSSSSTSSSSSSSVVLLMDTIFPAALRCLMSLLDCLLRCIGLENVCGGPGAALVCPTCDADVCARCGREWHGAWAGSCEAVIDLTLQEFRKEKFLQPCPNCRREVEKVDACPHMSCPCGHQWCWVCRGNFPCANLHFGKSGYGSSTEIGNLRNIQRLAVVARMVSTCCFFPIFGLFIASGSTVWMLVLLVTGCLASCFCCFKRIARYKSFQMLEPVVTKYRYKAKKIAKVFGYACTGFPILIGVCLFIAFVFICIGLLHLVGLFLIPVSVVYICADTKKWMEVRSGTVKRLWSKKGWGGLFDVFDEEEVALEPYQSSLNTKFEVIDCSSEFFISILRGEPSAKFIRAYCPAKGGHLSHKFVSLGRRALASTMFALCFPPTFALGCCLAPFAPLFLLPLAVYPRDPIPRHIAPLVSPFVGALFFVIFAYLVPVWFSGLASVFDPAKAGLLPSIIPGCIAAVIAWVLLRRPALSSCSCCAPLWLIAYSIPLSLVVGEYKSRRYLAFTSVPDIILQLPTMFIMLFIEHLLEG